MYDGPKAEQALALSCVQESKRDQLLRMKKGADLRKNSKRSK